jgi:3-hydroxybutyryl-CoA dehydrogenase
MNGGNFYNLIHMDGKKTNAEPVLIVGNGNLTYSIAVCLLKTKYINLCTDDLNEARNIILTHLSEMKNEIGKDIIDDNKLKISDSFKKDKYGLAIVITAEDLVIKKDAISQLEKKLSPGTIIAINTESICLDVIQEDAIHPERIIGLNWTEPAHTTHFLEIITNSSVKEGVADQVANMAKSWNKDAYIVENFGIRSRLISAMVREAFYLIENGYASVEDIDRACRNDAGYYLPFAGNCRYMDLMGTYAYGMVMKDLNPDLSKEKQLPEFFTDILKQGGLGMKNGKGLYHYTPDEIKHWQKIVSEFSYQIEDIIDKYPFNYKKKIH